MHCYYVLRIWPRKWLSLPQYRFQFKFLQATALLGPKPVVPLDVADIPTTYFAHGIQTIYVHDDKLVKKIPFDVRRQLIRSMKKKWDEVNKEYQLLTLSLFNLDTVNKVSNQGAEDQSAEFSGLLLCGQLRMI
jgi:hypothetical protein